MKELLYMLTSIILFLSLLTSFALHRKVKELEKTDYYCRIATKNMANIEKEWGFKQ